MDVAIIILHYGDVQVTKECIKSISHKETYPHIIILVNNDKIRLTDAMFGKKKNLFIINNKKNLGFAGGVNVGIKVAMDKKASFIMLLNNDTKIDTPILSKLVSFLKQTPSCGIVAPAIAYDKRGVLTFDLGGNLNNIFGRTNHTEVQRVENVMPRASVYVTGACMMIKAEVIKKVGYLDEQFFLYYEDVDFCLRAKLKGFSSFVLPSVVITHALSKSVGKVSKLAMYHQTKSALLFGRKYCQKTRFFNIAFILAQSCLFTIKRGIPGLVTFSAIRDTLL